MNVTGKKKKISRRHVIPQCSIMGGGWVGVGTSSIYLRFTQPDLMTDKK